MRFAKGKGIGATRPPTPRQAPEAQDSGQLGNRRPAGAGSGKEEAGQPASSPAAETVGQRSGETRRSRPRQRPEGDAAAQAVRHRQPEPEDSVRGASRRRIIGDTEGPEPGQPGSRAIGTAEKDARAGKPAPRIAGKAGPERQRGRAGTRRRPARGRAGSGATRGSSAGLRCRGNRPRGNPKPVPTAQSAALCVQSNLPRQHRPGLQGRKAIRVPAAVTSDGKAGPRKGSGLFVSARCSLSQCIAGPSPLGLPGLFLLSRNARKISTTEPHDSSMYTSWYAWNCACWFSWL